MSLCIWTDREIPTHSFRKMYSACFMLTIMMRYYEDVSEEFNVLRICSIGNDHKQVNKLCNREFVLPAGRTRRKRVAIVLPTAVLRNIAYLAYA